MKVLITRGYHFNEEQLKQIENLGCEVVVWHTEEEPVPPEHRDADILVNYQMLKRMEVSDFTNLKLIQMTSAGLDHVPVEEIRRLGIQLCNARGIYSIPMAEWVVLKVLEIYKKTREFEARQRRGEWKQERSIEELYGKTVGILGTGSIGTEVAKRMQAFGCRVLGLNTQGTAVPFFDQCYAATELNTLLPLCDVVVLTLPLTEDTHHLLNEETLGRMKEDAVLVNVSRGPVVHEKALVHHLDEGHLLAAALDVFETEPLPTDHSLWQHPKILATPHNSFFSKVVKNRMFHLAYDNIKAYMEKKPLTNLQI